MSEAHTDASRAKVVEAARQHFRSQAKRNIVPGQDYIPVTGKILDEDDLVNLVESSLDMWLTAGRFATEFEKCFGCWRRSTGGDTSRRKSKLES